MLTYLQIRDFAIIDAIELELHPGLTVLTGETGAGKSILVDALQLLAGGRAGAEVVRHGAERAEITGTFDLTKTPRELKRWLEEQSITTGDELSIRRVVASDGRSIAICGDSGAGKSTLAAALCRGGCSFVTDDLCVVVPNENKRPVILPDGRKLKLWKETIDNLDLVARQGEAVRQSFEKYYIEPFETVSDPPILSAISSQRRRTMPWVQPELCGVTMTLGNS